MVTVKLRMIKKLYTIESFLGVGGQGKVYKVRSKRDGKEHTLKKVDITGIEEGNKVAEKRYQRVLREAEVLKKLDHPNIIRFYDLFFYNEGIDRYVCTIYDYIQGETLSAKISKENRIPFEKKIEYFSQIADAISYIHGKGVLHRDIKPSNIFVTENERGSKVVIGDFGVAKYDEKNSDRVINNEKEKITDVGEIIGTLDYLAPEVLEFYVNGEDKKQKNTYLKWSRMSDIYSLGVLAYEMLTSHSLFESGSHFGKIHEIYYRVIDERDFYRYDKNLPEYLVQSCLKAMNKDPKKRFQSVREFYLALGDNSKFNKNNKLSQYSQKSVEGDISKREFVEGMLPCVDLSKRPNEKFIERTVEKFTVGSFIETRYLADLYFCSCKQSEYVIQILDKEVDEDEDELFQYDLEKYANIYHPNKLQIVDYQLVDEAYYVIIENTYSENFKNMKEFFLSYEDVLDSFVQLAEVVAKFHEEGIVHGNLHPYNVYFYREKHKRVNYLEPLVGIPLVKRLFKSLVEFDFEEKKNKKSIEEKRKDALLKMGVTRNYYSPELFEKFGYTQRIDVYSLTVMLMEKLIEGNIHKLGMKGDEVQKIHKRLLEVFNSDERISNEVKEICRKGISVDKIYYQNACAFLKDLEEAVYAKKTVTKKEDIKYIGKLRSQDRKLWKNIQNNTRDSRIKVEELFILLHKAVPYSEFYVNEKALELIRAGELTAISTVLPEVYREVLIKSIKKQKVEGLDIIEGNNYTKEKYIARSISLREIMGAHKYHRMGDYVPAYEILKKNDFDPENISFLAIQGILMVSLQVALYAHMPREYFNQKNTNTWRWGFTPDNKHWLGEVDINPYITRGEKYVEDDKHNEYKTLINVKDFFFYKYLYKINEANYERYGKVNRENTYERNRKMEKIKEVISHSEFLDEEHRYALSGNYEDNHCYYKKAIENYRKAINIGIEKKKHYFVQEIFKLYTEANKKEGSSLLLSGNDTFFVRS